MPDDLCDLCMSSGVTVDRTTYCGLTIGVECGCDDQNRDGKCNNPDCVECAEEDAKQDEEDRYQDA